MAPHNIWLSCPPLARAGDEVKCFINFGHYFTVQGKADPLRTRAWMVTPGGEKMPLSIADGETELAISFTPTSTGTYTVLAEYDGKIWSIAGDGRHLRGPRADQPGIEIEKSVYYYQCAKAFITVEEDITWPGPSGTELEIIPHPNNGGVLPVTVTYGGKPLADAQVYAFRQGDQPAHIARTDNMGKANLPLAPGSWMLLVSHQDPAKGVAGQYDERGLTAVFTFTQT
ncbi:MAG: DUF4198 domain-containing protein [Bacillota bacterium]